MSFATLSTVVDRYVPAGENNGRSIEKIGAALNSAYSSLAGGTVTLGPGKHYLDHATIGALLLPAATAHSRGRVTLRGDGATLVLSSRTPSVFRFGKVNDGDTFGWLNIEDLDVDANNTGGKYHVLLGTYNNGAVLSRINVAHLTVRNVNIYNVPTDATLTDHRLGAWLAVARSAAGTAEGAPNTITDVTFENYRQEGGNAGIAIVGTGPAVDDLEVYIDDVMLEDCYHDTLVAPTAFFTSSNFHLGSRGYGGTGTIRRCHGYNSGDVGVETNAFDNMVVENCDMHDTWNIAYYHTLYHTPDHPATQKVTYRDSSSECNIAAALGHHVRIGENMSIPIGRVRAEGGSYRRDFGGGDLPATVGSGVALVNNSECRSLKVKGLDMEFANFVSTGVKAINAIIATAGVTRCTVSVEDIGVIVSGTRSSGTLTITGLNVSGIMSLWADEWDVDMNVVTSSVNGLRGFDLGTNAASQMRGGVTRLRIRQMAGDTQPRGIIVRRVEDLTLDAPFLIEKCDLTASGASVGGTAILYTATSNAANVTERDNRV